MGLFDSAIRVATGAEKEGLAVLSEVLADLSRQKLPAEGRRGALETIRAVFRALKKRGVATSDTEAKAERMIALYEKESVQ